MKHLSITSGQNLGEFLDRVIEEGVKSVLTRQALQEKEKQVAAAPQQTQDASSGDEGGETNLFSGGDSGEAPAPSKTMDDESEKLKSGNVKLEDIVEKLNAIRSGRSFKDEQISAAMSQYIDSLSKAERTALLAFLKGIAQIVTGEVSGEQATDPTSKPSDVKMEKGDSVSTKHLKPNVIKASPPVKAAGPGAENTTPPAPIVPKKKQ